MSASCFAPGKLLGIALLAILLTACGGGGGGGANGTPNPAPGFSVSVDRSELRFDGEEGRAPQPLAVLGTSQGDPQGTVYTGALDLGTSLDKVTTELIGSQVKFTVYPKPNLPAGTYKGSVQLFACPDNHCTRHFSGSPVDVPYTITIAKGLKITPSPVLLSAVSGATASSDISVQLPDGQSSFTVNTATPWISTANLSTSGFTITTLPMPPGNYSGNVSVSLPGRSIDLPVTYTVTGDASTVTQLSADVTSMNFSATASTTPATVRTVNVTLPSWLKELNTTVNYVGATGNWLKLTKTGERSYTVSVSALNLVAGTYTANLVVSAGPTVAPLQIPVSFIVSAPSWSIAGGTAFLVNGTSTQDQLSSDIQVDVPSLPPQAWNASTTSSWLKLLTASGTTGSSKLRVQVDSTELLKLANFSAYTAQVVVTAANSNVPAQQLTFTLDKRLPQLNYVSPATRLPNESGPLIVRGRGFAAIADLAHTLDVGGANVTNITRVNDTELLLQVAGAAVGQSTFRLNNTLGAATGSATLKVIAQPGFSYQAIPTQGAKGSIYFDPERQSIYASNKTLGSLMRFAHAGAGWSITSAAIPSIESAAMAPDGATLLTTSTAGNVTLLDPATLATQASYQTQQISGYVYNSLPTLAMTNNGKAYFQGSTWANGMAYFDLTTRTFGATTSTNVGFDFYSGPWYSVSGDGERLVIVQSASISPTPPMLYMNSSDESPKANPAGLTFWYEAAQSLHGERFADGTTKVWDRDFNLVGNADLPDTAYFGRTPVFSPDGTRLYVLAYNSNVFNGSADKPRVYVFDTSTRLVTTTSLPVLGYFELTDYPTCTTSAYECNTRALGTISPDGSTLFFIGDTNLVVAPIPALRAVAARASIQRARAGANVVPDNMVPHQLKQR